MWTYVISAAKYIIFLETETQILSVGQQQGRLRSF